MKTPVGQADEEFPRETEGSARAVGPRPGSGQDADKSGEKSP